MKIDDLKEFPKSYDVFPIEFRDGVYVTPEDLRSAASYLDQRPTSKQRNHESLLLSRLSGATLDACASTFEISKSRVAQILYKILRVARWNKKDPEARDRNVAIHRLMGEGLNFRAASTLHELKRLTPVSVSELTSSTLLSQPNFGKKSLEEVRFWLNRNGHDLSDHDQTVAELERRKRYLESELLKVRERLSRLGAS